MKQPTTAADFLPRRIIYPALARAAEGCRGCELYKFATQVVFGEGAYPAPLMLVGEQPGDAEDKEGHPFVGGSGKLLQAILDEAGILRQEVYITNAVKHFRFEERGKRRLHKQPSARHIKACHPWLEAEFAVVKPKVVLCLGATAAKAILGNAFRLTADRGRWQQGENFKVLATYHPSAALRAPDHDRREQILRWMKADFKKAKAVL